jgi:protoheme IX farnesyltransferase
MTSAVAAKTLDVVALAKPRILVMSVLTAAGAMSLAPEPASLVHAVLALVGTALIVAAANTLNMWLERDTDCLMARTRNRPLPQHRIAPRTALVAGAFQGAVSLPVLALAGIVPAALGLVALLLYVGCYTPMKLRTPWATWVGALAGAMPAVMGWTAATGRLDLDGLLVYAVLVVWQVPHTHAIAIYRKRDYAAAGMKTLPATRGLAVAKRSIALWLGVQVALSLAVYARGIAGLPYAVVAGVLGALVLGQGLRWPKTHASPDSAAQVDAGTMKWARDVFLVSIAYVPILFATMVVAGTR